MTKKISKCLISKKDIYQILDFGMQPYADTFINKNQLNLNEPVFPLEIFLNPENGMIQVGIVTNDFDRYNLYSYSYTSSNSDLSKNHWRDLYKKVKDKFNPTKKFIVEVGSNDGFLVSMFGDNNKILGIDSSKEMVDISNRNGIKSIHKIFNHATAKEIVSKYGTCDILLANNVFNHSNDPVDFARGVHHMISNDGIFIFELPYWMDTVRSGKFDQIYHEHISYFTVKSAYYLLKEADLEIFDIELVDYHGGSLRVYSRKSDNVKMNKLVRDYIESETQFGLFEFSTYDKWQLEIKRKRTEFLINFLKIKSASPNSLIIGVGAAAKANTFLNYYRLDNSFIDYITDASPHKIGKFTPLTRIPIVEDEIFSKYDDVYALILSWNISSDLRNILLKINPKIKFISI